ncbi:phosphoribosylglycinamide formyltransferase [bacterium]|nr:phosphoribosylglycinamide formyltransferase [bacterium]
MTRIAVFASGRGSNFEALAAAAREGRVPARIALLLSDREDAGALDVAARFGIEAVALKPAGRRGALDADWEAACLAACRRAGAEWICLAGFMRILGPALLDAYRDRVMNIHPSLLPSFPGLDAQRQAWEHGVRVSGCTVHLVDAGVDTGPIVAQRAVSAEGVGSADALAARILEAEHTLYAEALERLLAGGWRRDGRRLVFTPSPEGRS